MTIPINASRLKYRNEENYRNSGSQGVHTNIIIIGYPLETDMSDRRITCLMVDQSETDRHASSEINMPDRRPICLIKEPNWHPLETDPGQDM